MFSKSKLMGAAVGLAALAMTAGANAATLTISDTVAQSGLYGYFTSPTALTGATPWTFTPGAYTNIIDATVTIEMFDGDTGYGDFDWNQLSLSLDGYDTGIKLNGFIDEYVFVATIGPEALAMNGAAILAALNADFQLAGGIIDLSPYDNFIGLSGAFSTTLTLTVETYTPPPPTYVPEPATLGLFGLSLAGIGFLRRRKSA